MQWIFGFERQLTSNTTLTANYVGAKDTRIQFVMIQNTAPVPGPGAVSTRVPFPYISPGEIDWTLFGLAHYNALQVSVNHSYAGGLSYLVSYTWEKQTDQGCTDEGGDCSVPNPYDLLADRTIAGTDLPQILTGTLLYDLPFGPNRRFHPSNNVVNQLIGDWQFNSILTLQSGLPFSLASVGDNANTGNKGNYNRPNLTGNLSLSHPSVAEWFNTAAVAAPAQYTFGNLSRNSCRTQGLRNDDLSLFRSFSILEGRSLEFRAEVFNFTNTPTWAQPGSTLGIAHFGQITATSSTAREWQFAVKLHY